MVVYQLGALDGIARRAGGRVTHMSFHGALGNMAAADPALAEPLVQAVAEFDRALTVLTSASARHRGRRRPGRAARRPLLPGRPRLGQDGLLVSRKLPGAVIHDPAAVVERVRRLLADGTVVTHAGAVIPMPCTSILLHGDTPGALELARRCEGRWWRPGAGRCRCPATGPHHSGRLSAHKRIVLAPSLRCAHR